MYDFKLEYTDLSGKVGYAYMIARNAVEAEAMLNAEPDIVRSKCVRMLLYDDITGETPLHTDCNKPT